jgi:hypothetical protein
MYHSNHSSPISVHSCLFVLFALFVLPLSAQLTQVRNGELWYDTQGNDVQAHGAGFLYQDGTYYMVGEDRRNGTGVNLYSSTDLMHWTFRNKIISTATNSQLADGSRFIERPKLLYNAKTKTYVVWLHYEGAAYAPAEAGVFKCDKVDGNYEFVRGARPFGNMSRDCGTFVDDDSTAYFFSSSNNNSDMMIYRLTDDYLDVDSQVNKIFIGQYREAPVMFKRRGTYYMLSSGCTGWSPNQMKYATASSINGTWSSLVTLAPGISYDTQPTYLISPPGTQDSTFIFVADRWQDPALAESKTIMFPLTVNDDATLNLHYANAWNMDLTTGQWRVNHDDYLPRDGWSILDYDCQNSTEEAATNILDGSTSTIWHTTYSPSTIAPPHHVSIDMGKEQTVGGIVLTPRMDDSSNGIIWGYLLYATLDSTHWGDPVAGGFQTFDGRKYFAPVKARYLRIVQTQEFQNNQYASMSEFNALGVDTVKRTYPVITPLYSINDAPLQQGTDITVQKGQGLTLAPSAGKDGGWSWQLPRGNYDSSSKLSIAYARASNSGIYFAAYTDPLGRSAVVRYNVTVKDTSVDVSPKTGGSYLLVNRNSGKVLTPKDDSAEAGAQLVQMPVSGNSNQIWRMDSVDVDYVAFVNLGNGLAMDINGASTATGAANIQWTYTAAKNQQWLLTPVGDYYTLQNRNSGLLVDINACSTDDGANSIQWSANGGTNQQWILRPADVPSAILQPTLTAVPHSAYNLAGQRVSATYKGIVIVNGKKILRK